MKIVNVLLDHGRVTSRSDFYPLFRWREALLRHGIKVNFFYSLDSKLYNSDVVILSSRYFMDWQDITRRNIKSEEKLISVLQELSKKTNKLIWFDVADTTGSTDFGIISYVDTFWKKQLLVDVNKYSLSTKKNVRVWLPQKIQDEYIIGTPFDYSPCPINNIKKLKIAWNIGFNDYRFSNKYLAGLSLLFPKNKGLRPKIISHENREIDILNRGSVLESKNVHSYQRNMIFSKLSLIQNRYIDKHIITNGYIKKTKYYRELQNSKVVISPFGWGEVCYKDFEIVLAGALMLKPNMSHLNTFPNIYNEGKTYLSLNWDLSNFNEVIEKVFCNPKMAEDISKEAFESYLNQYNNSLIFVKHFAEIIK